MLTALPRLKARGLDRLRDGDVVLADASEDTVGISKLVELTNVGVTEVVSGQHTIAIRFDPAVAVNGFKGYLQFCPPFAQHLRRLAAGTKVYAINRQHVASIEMPLPPVEEQRSIATALTDVDALLDGLDRLIVKKRDLKQAAMQQLLTGRMRLPGFTEEWEERTLSDFGATYGGLTGKTKADFGSGAAQYVTFMNVMANVVIDCGTFERVKVAPKESQNRVLKGDLLFNGSSETPEEVAMCAVMTADVPKLFLNSFCFGFRFRDDDEAPDALFLAYYLRSKEGRELMKSLAQGSTRYNLSKLALLKSPLRVPAPPEQYVIATVLSDMDAELRTLEARRDKTRLLKQAMMQELLTGRTRLVDTQGATA